MYYNQNYNAYPQGYPNSIYGSSFNSPMQPQIRSEIVKVNGENGARAYQLPRTVPHFCLTNLWTLSRQQTNGFTTR